MRGTIFALTILGLATLAGACNDGSGPTAIEIPIDRIELEGPSALIETESATFRATAFSGEQQVGNPVLRWQTSDGSKLSISTEGSSTALVTARGSGKATVTVSNSTGDVSDQITVTILSASPK